MVTRNTAILLAALTIVATSQDKAASRPKETVVLPKAEQARPFDAKDAIVLTVSRASAATATESRASAGDVWTIMVADKSYPLDQRGSDSLSSYFTQQSRDSIQKTEPRLSERIVLVQADAEAPYVALQVILEACAAAKIHKVSLEVAPLPDGKRRAFSPWELPERSPDPKLKSVNGKEIRVIVMLDPKTNKVQRIAHSAILPPTAEGDSRLEALVKLEDEAYRKVLVAAPLALDSGSSVPWQAIITVMDIAKRAGVHDVRFGFGKPLK